ncbi:Glyoxylase [Parelusimicrobium proximum]|uniref:MBL fold metallo-hydrolase n=1 Tax=Parelusimicrobium proximum TaxID=3228953 RepID=UPI003D175FE0
MSIKVKTLEVGPMMNCCYLVTNGSGAILIDPGWDMEKIEDEIKDLHLKAVFFTHGHFDHLQHAEAIMKNHNLKAYIDERDKDLAALPAKAMQPYAAPADFNIAGMDIHVIHTPGHTQGGVCIKIEDNLFTGDTLFPGMCGRVDLLQSDPRKMRQSLYTLSTLPPETKVYAGHSYDGKSTSTIGEERVNNHFMAKAITDHDRGVL